MTWRGLKVCSISIHSILAEFSKALLNKGCQTKHFFCCYLAEAYCQLISRLSLQCNWGFQFQLRCIHIENVNAILIATWICAYVCVYTQVLMYTSSTNVSPRNTTRYPVQAGAIFHPRLGCISIVPLACISRKCFDVLQIACANNNIVKAGVGTMIAFIPATTIFLIFLINFIF